jgi:hypothetical protein
MRLVPSLAACHFFFLSEPYSPRSDVTQFRVTALRRKKKKKKKKKRGGDAVAASDGAASDYRGKSGREASM